MTRNYVIEAVWWIALGLVLGAIVRLLLNRPRRKEKEQ